MLIRVVLFCVWEGAGAWLTEVVPLTCTSGIEGQCPLSSPSWVLSGWTAEAAAEADGAMPWHPVFTDVAGNSVYLWEETEHAVCGLLWLFFHDESSRASLLLEDMEVQSLALWCLVLCCQRWNWSRCGAISQCFYYPHTRFAVVLLTSRLSVLLSFLLFFPNLSYLSHHLCL